MQAKFMHDFLEWQWPNGKLQLHILLPNIPKTNIDPEMPSPMNFFVQCLGMVRQFGTSELQP